MAQPTLHEALDGHVALVTGANRGIGLAIARGLGALGATVYAGTRGDPPDAQGAIPINLDVTQAEAIDDAIRRINDEQGRLDILVNNAGVFGHAARLEHVPMAEIDAVITTNLRGPFLTTRAALKLLLARPGGRIVNVSSGAGSFAEGLYPSHAAYGASKAGLNALTRCLHLSHARQGLIANAVCPGWVATDMGGPSAPRSPPKGAQTPVWLARFAPGAPGGRFWRDQHQIQW